MKKIRQRNPSTADLSVGFMLLILKSIRSRLMKVVVLESVEDFMNNSS
jgi:hypothetical protein